METGILKSENIRQVGDIRSRSVKPSKEAPPSDEENATATPVPGVVHRFRNDRSILCLVVDEDLVYAGSQSGNLLVRGK